MNHVMMVVCGAVLMQSVYHNASAGAYLVGNPSMAAEPMPHNRECTPCGSLRTRL